MSSGRISEGMSSNYREPYSYRQNKHESMDDANKPSSALELRRGFDMDWKYDRARKDWPEQNHAPINEDLGGGANLSSQAVGPNTPENALSVRTIGSNGLGSAERGITTNQWDSAYTSLSEASEELNSLLTEFQTYIKK